MNTDITRTRASNADRERYAAHLSTLYADGYITTFEEAEQVREKILSARTLYHLRIATDGMPQPKDSRRHISGLDEDHPGRFWAAAGILVVYSVVVPSVVATIKGEPYGGAIDALLWFVILSGIGGLIALFVRAFRVFDW